MKMNEEQLNRVVTEGKEALIALYNRGEQAIGVETLVDATMQLIHRACDEWCTTTGALTIGGHTK